MVFIREGRSQNLEKSLRIIGNPRKIEYAKQQEITKERYKEEGGKGLLKLEITFLDTHSESSLTILSILCRATNIIWTFAIKHSPRSFTLSFRWFSS